jgi:hypothetical protein
LVQQPSRDTLKIGERITLKSGDLFRIQKLYETRPPFTTYLIFLGEVNNIPLRVERNNALTYTIIARLLDIALATGCKTNHTYVTNIHTQTFVRWQNIFRHSNTNYIAKYGQVWYDCNKEPKWMKLFRGHALTWSYTRQTVDCRNGRSWNYSYWVLVEVLKTPSTDHKFTEWSTLKFFWSCPLVVILEVQVSNLACTVSTRYIVCRYPIWARSHIGTVSARIISTPVCSIWKDICI